VTVAADISVIVATFGDEAVWKPLAARAIDSAARQSLKPNEIVEIHGPTLAAARNRGAQDAKSEWLCFLDADDELAPGYIEAIDGMTYGDIKVPAVQWMPEGEEPKAPEMLPYCDIYGGNFIVIGAIHRKSDFLTVGGFRELPSLEDWDLWIRLIRAGATVADCPLAVYRARLRKGSRNDDWPLRDRTYHEIRRFYGVER